MATKKTTKKAAKTAATKIRKSATRSVRLDQRTPAGTVLKRTYKGRELEVHVTDAGYEYEDQAFTSISAVARRITGYRQISGPAFFRLDAPADSGAGAGAGGND